MSHLNEKTLKRFWSKVNITPGCWIWNAGKNTDGYGAICIGGTMKRAHRVSYEIAYGIIPNGMCVCHHCDTPKCVNPEHLFLGSLADNAADRDSKGRNAFQRGVNHSTAKLSPAAVKSIRSLFDQGYTRRALGLKFGVHETNIRHILNRKTWGHV